MDRLKIYLVISVTVLVISALLALLLSRIKKKSGWILTPFNTLTFGTLLACFLLFVPLYFAYFSEPGGNIIEILLMSVHNTIRLFVVDTDFDFVRDSVVSNETDPVTAKVFSTYAAILFILAPLLTYGFIISLFKNASFFFRMFFNQFSRIYVFSCLNKRSLALARSKREERPHAIIIFTGVPEDCGEDMTELKETAGSIGARCFSKGIADIRLWRMKCAGNITFYIMDTDDDDSIRKANDVKNKYGSRKKASMLVFVDSEICSLALSNLILPAGPDGKPADKKIRMKITSVDTVWSFIYGLIDKYGLKLFDNAKPMPGSEEKIISALIVGCGTYGSAMIKTLAWYCQVDGYRLNVNVIDPRPDADSCFAAECPDLTDPKYNGGDDIGSARYTIRFFTGVNLMSAKLESIVKKLGITTFAFVDAGSDRNNVILAMRLRTAFRRINIHPDIQAVVDDPLISKSLDNIHSYKGRGYDIDLVGDIDSRYSTKATEESEFITEALDAHNNWGEEKTFWAYDFNRRSALAFSLFKKLLKDLEIPEAELEKGRRTPKQEEYFRRTQHRRWIAQKRSEGYIYGKKRDEIAKTHDLLVSYDDLPPGTKIDT